MTFRAVFCDIDGTLLDSRHALPPGTAKAVREVHAGGTPFILVSARSPGGVYPVQRRIGITGPVVCYGGALVLDKGGDPVHSLGIGMGRIAELKRGIHAEWPGVAATVYSGDSWFVDDVRDPKIVTESGITGAVPTGVAAADLTARAEEAHKVFCIGEPEDILAMERRVGEGNPDLAVVKSSPHFLEIMNGSATKSNALKFLCRAMRLPTAEAVAFGDNYNDIDMLESAGLGVAMGNAPDEVKRCADMVAGSNDEEGVRHMLASLRFQSMAHSVRFDRAFF